MKKIIFTLLFLTGSIMASNAQKFAYVDSQYILSKIPDYKVAQDQLNQLSIGWQKEIEAKKQKRQTEIEKKEQDVKDLQKQRFGVNGDLFKKRQELVKPLQDKIYNAVQALAERENLAVIFDKSSDLTMLYTNLKYDKSDQILKDMGYSTGTGSGTGTGTNKSK